MKEVAVSTKVKTINLNPLTHLTTGIKSLLQTNLTAILVLVLINFAATVAAVSLMLFFELDKINILPIDSTSVLAKILAFFIITGIVCGVINLAITKMVMASSSKQKVSVGDALKTAVQRLPLAVIFLLAVSGVIIIVIGAVVVGYNIAPLLGILLGLVATILAVIYALKLLYVQFLLVETKKPAGLKDIAVRSTAIFKKSISAIIIYLATMGLFFMILSAILMPIESSQDNSQKLNTVQNNIQMADIFDANINSSDMIMSIISVIVLAGMANIYNEAKKLTGK